MVFLACLVMLAWGKLPAAVFGDITIFVTGLYMAGNVGEHVSEAWKERAGKTMNPEAKK